MRRKWRTRLYRFDPDADYKAMVLDPAHRAKAMFIATAIGGGAVPAESFASPFSLIHCWQPLRERRLAARSI
jgi:hypothetical protein